jgi:hypothetical protein
MKKIITAVCVILIIAVIIYAILSHSSSSSNSSSNTNSGTTCNKNEEYVGNACQCKSAFVRDFGGNCSSQCGDNQIVINGNCQCKDGYIKDKNECKNSPVPPPPPPPPSPSCDDISQINASGVCTKWEYIQTYDAPTQLGGVSDKGLVIYTPNGIKLNNMDVYKDNIDIQIFCSLNIGVDSSSIIYMCINEKWSKDQRLKSDGIMQVKENSTKFFAMSAVNIYTMEKNENSAWINNSLPPNISFLNVNDGYIVVWGSTDVYLSSDFGKSWNKISVPPDILYWCYVTSDNALLVATAIGVYKTNLPNINFSQILNFHAESYYATACINQYKDEIVVLSQDSFDEKMMPSYIFYSPNNGKSFMKLNLIIENNLQLWPAFSVYVYNGVIYLMSIGKKRAKTDFIELNKSFLYKFNVK